MNKKNAVVIGTGFGGLSAGFHLLKKGYQVKFLESRSQPGGRADVFKKSGYTFDAGPTVITAPYLFDELYSLVGEKFSDHVSLVPVDPFYRIIFNEGSQFDYVGDESRLLENISKISPQDVEGYKKLSEHAKKIFDVGYLKLADQPFDTFSSMLKVIPDMVRLRNYKTVYSLVSKYIKDERLRQAFSFEPLLVGGNPLKITSIYMLIHYLERKWGVHYAMGGTGSIVNSMVDVLKSKGCEFYFNSRVERIEVIGSRVQSVTCSNGSKYDCDLVVNNGDPIKTYTEWIDKKHIKNFFTKRSSQKSLSMSLFVIYFGVKKKFKNLAHHTVILGPRYQGLLTDIFENKVLSEDFSLYLHAPTVTDPSMAPEGCECFYVLSPVPNNLSEINWPEESEKYKNKIIDFLDAKHLPGLKENLEVCFSIDPNYFENSLHSTKGAAFGIEPSFSQSAYFRFHNKCPDIKGLYFVGANTHPGAGVPGVINSAKVLNRSIPDVANGGSVL